MLVEYVYCVVKLTYLRNAVIFPYGWQGMEMGAHLFSVVGTYFPGRYLHRKTS